MKAYKYLSAAEKREENKRRYRKAMGIVENVVPVVASTPRDIKKGMKWNKAKSIGTCLPRAIRFPGSLESDLKKIRREFKKNGIEAAYNVARKIG